MGLEKKIINALIGASLPVWLGTCTAPEKIVASSPENNPYNLPHIPARPSVSVSPLERGYIKNPNLDNRGNLIIDEYTVIDSSYSLSGDLIVNENADLRLLDGASMVMNSSYNGQYSVVSRKGSKFVATGANFSSGTGRSFNVYFDHPSYLFVDNCSFTDVGHNDGELSRVGVVIMGDSQSKITVTNTNLNNVYRGLVINGDPTSRIEDAVIDGNTVVGSTESAYSVRYVNHSWFQGMFRDLTDNSGHVIFGLADAVGNYVVYNMFELTEVSSNNKCIGLSPLGFNSLGADSTIVARNETYGGKNGIGLAKCVGNKVFDNTIIGAGKGWYDTAEPAGIRIFEEARDNLIVGNLIGWCNAGYGYYGGDTSLENTFSYNTFVNNGVNVQLQGGNGTRWPYIRKNFFAVNTDCSAPNSPSAPFSCLLEPITSCDEAMATIVDWSGQPLPPTPENLSLINPLGVTPYIPKEHYPAQEYPLFGDLNIQYCN